MTSWYLRTVSFFLYFDGKDGNLKADRENELLDRYQFIQKFKKESRQFGAQRRASEGRAAELALPSLVCAIK